MNANLLRTYVFLMVEKVRSKRGQNVRVGSEDYGDRFSMQRFTKLGDTNEMLFYANKFLEKLGQGSARAAFLFSGRFALKIALNDAGIAQNEAEVDVYTNPQTKQVVTGIHQSDPKFRWIVSDLVKPLRSSEEFEQLSGISWTRYLEYVVSALKWGTNDAGAPPFVKAVIQTARTSHLKKGDIASEDSYQHYGKTGDGRLVILDYGFTEDVFNAHYKKPAPPPALGGGAKTAKTVKTVRDVKTAKNVQDPRDAKTPKLGKAG